MIRKLLLVLALLMVAAISVGAIVLLPAHKQIREVAITIPTLAEVDAGLATDLPGPVSVSYLNTARQQGPGLDLSHTVVLLRWADGRLFLIDTGMDREAAVAFGAPLELLMGAGAVQSFGAVDAQMGDAVQAVRGIGFTHLHVDHTSGVTAICQAQGEPATIFQTPYQSSLQNLHTEAGQQRVESSACRREILASGTVLPVPGFPGLVAVPAGGHTPGSTVFVARVGAQTWLFSGDLTNSLREIVEDRDKGLIYSYLLVPENVALLARWRQWLRTADADVDMRVIVAHDLRSYAVNGVSRWATPP